MTSPICTPTSRQLQYANALAWQAWHTAGQRPAPNGRSAMLPKWLIDRGLNPAAVHAAGFEVGYAPDSWQTLGPLLARHGVPAAAATHTGLVRISENGRRYDGFRDRIMLPVRALVGGQIVGFFGRRCNDTHNTDRTPKYLNSPANAIYHKSDLLFGAWEGRQRVQANPAAVTAIVLCEGPMDVLSVASQGPWAAIAPGGTALTSEQAAWIVAMSRSWKVPVILAYDGDQAGEAAEWRAWESLRPSLGSDLIMGDIPQGRDPGDLTGPELATALAGPRR